MAKVFRIIIGVALLLLGLVGLVLPILQGWLLLAIGCIVLSVDIPYIRNIIVLIYRRFPYLKHPLKKWRSWLGHKRKRH